MQNYQYYVYIMGSPAGVLYIGVTNNLEKRVWEHKNSVTDGFTKKYNCTELLYYEVTSDVRAAIAREKQLKRWNRDKKELLIQSMNSKWRDLAKYLFSQDPSTHLGVDPSLTRDDRRV